MIYSQVNTNLLAHPPGFNISQVDRRGEGGEARAPSGATGEKGRQGRRWDGGESDGRTLLEGTIGTGQDIGGCDGQTERRRLGSAKGFEKTR